jgi:hypothetical protein
MEASDSNILSCSQSGFRGYRIVVCIVKATCLPRSLRWEHRVRMHWYVLCILCWRCCHMREVAGSTPCLDFYLLCEPSCVSLRLLCNVLCVMRFLVVKADTHCLHKSADKNRLRKCVVGVSRTTSIYSPPTSATDIGRRHRPPTSATDIGHRLTRQLSLVHSHYQLNCVVTTQIYRFLYPSLCFSLLPNSAD